MESKVENDRLNLKIIKRRFYFMMLEEQLRKHWYFQYSGGYSVKKKSRSILESLNYTIELLKHTGNVVTMFPQRQINSMHKYTINFEKGIDRIIQNSSSETQIVFVANLVDYFSDAKPNLFIYLKSFLAKDFKTVSAENEYSMFYEHSADLQKMKIS